MLVYGTIAKKVFWEFDSIIMQNVSDILPLFCTPTWPSHHVSENHELVNLVHFPGEKSVVNRQLTLKPIGQYQVTDEKGHLPMYTFQRNMRKIGAEI